MVNFLDVFVESASAIVFMLIFIVINKIRQNQSLQKLKETWFYLTAGSGIYFFSALVDILDEFEVKYFDFVEEILVIVSLSLILIGMVYLMKFTNLFKKE